MESHGPRQCVICGETYQSYKRGHYWPNYCQKHTYWDYVRWGRVVAHPKAPICLKGALSELTVACDLMAHGFDVYRSLSPHSLVDLIAYSRDTKILLRIEVTSGSTGKLSKAYHKPQHPENEQHRDLLAVVYPDNEIWYLKGKMRISLDRQKMTNDKPLIS